MIKDRTQETAEIEPNWKAVEILQESWSILSRPIECSLLLAAIFVFLLSETPVSSEQRHLIICHVTNYSSTIHGALAVSPGFPSCRRFEGEGLGTSLAAFDPRKILKTGIFIYFSRNK